MENSKEISQQETSSQTKPRRKIPAPAKLISKVGLGALAIGIGVRGGSGDIEPVTSAPLESPPASVENIKTSNENSPFAKLKKIASDEVKIESVSAFHATPSDIEDPAVTALREEISNRFAIEINSYDEVNGDSSSEPTKNETPQQAAVRIATQALKLLGDNRFIAPRWTEQKLMLLENILNDIPKGLYVPREDGEKIHVVLSSDTEMFCKGTKDISPKFSRELILGSNAFNVKEPLNSEYAVVHELDHIKTIEVCNGAENIVGEVNNILGASFDDLKEELEAKVQEKADQSSVQLAEYDGNNKPHYGNTKLLDQVLTPEDEAAFRLIRFRYGLTDPEEFMAVAGESDFLGKDYFYKMYSPFFPKETVDKLYIFIKDKIYDGREYGDYKTRVANIVSVNADGSYNYGNGVVGPSAKDREEVNSVKP